MAFSTLLRSDGNRPAQGEFVQDLLAGYFADGVVRSVEPGQSSAPPLSVVGEPPGTRDVAELGWTREQAARVRSALGAFQDDWNAPRMELYDTI